MLGFGALGEFALGGGPFDDSQIAWLMPLSQPVRSRPGLRPALQQFLAFHPAPSPFVATGWFMPLSEPVREKPGLRASLQQPLAAPSRLLPTPNLTGVLDATETKDTMLAGATLWNRITDAEIGVINTTPQPAEVGLSPAAPAAGVITVQISITMT